MSNEVVKIVRIDTGNSEQTVRALQEQTDSLRQSLAQLNEGTKEYQETVESLVASEEKLKSVFESISSNIDGFKSNFGDISKVFEGLDVQPFVDAFKEVVVAVKGVEEVLGTLDFDELVNSIAEVIEESGGLENMIPKEPQMTVAGLKEEINQLRDALLNAEKGSEEYARILDQLIEDQKKLTEVMNAGKKESTAAAGSYNALSQEMSALKKVWKETTDEATRKELGNRIKEINAQLSKFDQSIGDFRRNVGNYSQSITSAFGAMGGAAKGMIGPINGVKGALTAISSHPIVAVLTALAALLINGIAKGFKSSEENTNKLRVAFSAFQAIGDAVTKMFQKLAGWIAKVAEAAVNFADKLGLITPKMKERQELTKKQIELEKKERENITKLAKLETEASELRAKASDEENYSINQRIEFLKQAQAKEEEQLNLEKEILEQKVAQLEAQLALTDSTGEELTKLQDLKAQVIKINAQIADSQRKSNKEINALRRRGIQEQTQSNQQRLALEKELLQQEYDLAADGSDEQLRLAKELRKKELEIQQEGFKQKFKNRKEYDQAMKLAVQAYNNDIVSLEGQHLLKSREIEDKLNRIRLLGLREGSTAYIKEQKTQVENRRNELLKDEQDALAWVNEQLSNGVDEKTAKDSKIASLGGRSYLDIVEELAEYEKAIVRLSDELVKSIESDTERINQIILNSTMPMSRYYEVQLEQLKKYRSEMKPLNNETAEEFKLREDEVNRQISEAQLNRQNAYRQEVETYKEYLHDLDKLRKAQKVNPFTWNLYDDPISTLKKYYAELKNTHQEYLLDFTDFIQNDADRVATSIKSILNELITDVNGNLLSMEDFAEAKDSPLLKLFGIDAESAEDAKVQIDAITGEVVKTVMDARTALTAEAKDLIAEAIVQNGLVPQDAIDAYLQNLQNMVDTEKSILAERISNWSNVGSGIADIMSSVADIYEQDLKYQVEHGKKTQEQAEKEFEDIKALRIAVAVIDTIQGALAAFMGWQDKGQPWGAIIGAIQAAAVTAAGVAQIMQIRNTKFGGSSNPSGGSTMMAQVTPVFTDYQPEQVGIMTGQQEAEELANAITSKPIRAYVVESDITNAQQTASQRQSESTF